MIGLALIFTNKPAKAVITIDGKRKIRCDRLIFAANMNTKYEGGGMPMGPAANPFDGKITLCLVHDISRLTHLRLMPSVIKGNHIKQGSDEFDSRIQSVNHRIRLIILSQRYFFEHFKYLSVY